MSFAYDVKQEIAQRTGKPVFLKAQAYGLFLFGRSFSPEQVMLLTENEFAIQIACDWLHGLHLRPEVAEQPSRIDPQSRIFRLTLAGEAASSLLRSFDCKAAMPLNERLLKDETALAFFLGGAFLSCGNVTDPGKSYHLEFSVSDEALADELEGYVSAVVSCKRAVRKGMQVIYIKESEQIADLLTFLGAMTASVQLMQAKIVKEVRNKANRQTNCETANMSKTAAAAAAQCQDIRLIVEKLGWEGMPEELRALAHARLESPEATLRELGESLDPPLSRSGIAHRFARLAEMASAL